MGRKTGQLGKIPVDAEVALDSLVPAAIEHAVGCGCRGVLEKADRRDRPSEDVKSVTACGTTLPPTKTCNNHYLVGDLPQKRKSRILFAVKLRYD